jgi:hypothetical protein
MGGKIEAPVGKFWASFRIGEDEVWASVGDGEREMAFKGEG